MENKKIPLVWSAIAFSPLWLSRSLFAPRGSRVHASGTGSHHILVLRVRILQRKT